MQRQVQCSKCWIQIIKSDILKQTFDVMNSSNIVETLLDLGRRLMIYARSPRIRRAN